MISKKGGKSIVPLGNIVQGEREDSSSITKGKPEEEDPRPARGGCSLPITSTLLWSHTAPTQESYHIKESPWEP